MLISEEEIYIIRNGTGQKNLAVRNGLTIDFTCMSESNSASIVRRGRLPMNYPEKPF